MKENAGTVRWGRRGETVSFSPVDGITMWLVPGERLMAVWVRIEPDRELPLHQHPHEQIGVLIEGELTLTVGDESRQLQPGDSWSIPPDVPHRGVAGPGGCLAVDMFAPPRDDYVALARAAGTDRSASWHRGDEAVDAPEHDDTLSEQCEPKQRRQCLE